MSKQITKTELTETVNGMVIADLDVDHDIPAFKITLKDGRILSLADNGDGELSVAIFTDQAHYTEKVESFKRQGELRAIIRDALGEVARAISSGRIDVADKLITMLDEKAKKVGKKSDDTIQ